MSTSDADSQPCAGGPGRPGVVGPDGVIVEDITCRRCGYNLRGLGENGRCPECGTAVGLSIHGDLLRFAEPAWVEKLARGMELILVGIVTGIVGGCVGGGISAAGTPQSQAAGTLVILLSGLLSLVGAWILTTPDPSGIGEQRFVNARKVVRAGLIAGLAGQLINLVLPDSRSGPLFALAIVAATVCGLAGAVGTYAQYLYIERLAERIPDARLARLARFLRWGYSIVLGVSTLIGGIAAFYVVRSGPAAAGPGIAATLSGFGVILGVAGCAFGLGVLVMSIACIVLYIRARRAFREQAELARATWAAAAGGRAGGWEEGG